MIRNRLLCLICAFLFFGVFAGFSKKAYEAYPKVPIVYADQYNIGFWGLERLHPFDSAKYGKVVNAVCKKYGIVKEHFVKPSMVTDKELELVHTKEYLASLKKNSVIAEIVEVVPLYFLPDWFGWCNSLLQKYLLDPMRLATGGTLVAAQLALKNGKAAINLSGGYHHAKAYEGDGFCVFADVPYAAYKLWKKNPKLKIMVVDLDAHHGNGNADIFRNEKRAAIFDVYSWPNYPQYDNETKQYVKYGYPVQCNIGSEKCGVRDQEYLAVIDKLKDAIAEFEPGLIFYNAGTDILEGDTVGRMNISKEGVVIRDEKVFAIARELGVPVCMVTSGGYTKASADVIAASVTNLVDKGYIDMIRL